MYSRHIRPQVLCAEQNASELFLSWNGASIISDQVTKSVQRIWSKAGLGSDITLNIVRKTAVSSGHEAHPTRAGNLADLCHRQSNAQKCYRLTERERSSVLAAKTLAETLSGMNSTPQTENLMCHRQSNAQKCYRLIEPEWSSVLAAKTLAEMQSGLNSTPQTEDLMCHRQSNAEKCYRLIERERSSVLEAKTLAETLSGLNSTPQTEASAAATTTDMTAAISG